ncbi:universal stress protein [Ekhidna sp.]
MISSILIPTDFSPASWSAAQFGLEISRLNDEAIISFLHVFPVSAKYAYTNELISHDSKIKEVEDRMNQLAQNLLDRAEEKIRNVVLSGNVENTTLRFIKEHQFDLVIVGINSNGRNNELGSHTVSVIKESGVPVMIVPNRSENGAIAS